GVGRVVRGRGEHARGTPRSLDRSADLKAWGIEPIRVDVLDLGTLGAIPAESPLDLVYAVGFDRSAGIPMRTVYVNGLRNVLARLGDREGRRVYASSTGIYGQDDGGWVNEDAPTEPR